MIAVLSSPLARESAHAVLEQHKKKRGYGMCGQFGALDNQCKKSILRIKDIVERVGWRCGVASRYFG